MQANFCPCLATVLRKSTSHTFTNPARFGSSMELSGSDERSTCHYGKGTIPGRHLKFRELPCLRVDSQFGQIAFMY